MGNAHETGGAQDGVFDGAARRVVARLVAIRWLRVLYGSAAPVWIALLALLAALRVGGWAGSEWGLLVVGALLWVAACALVARARRPGKFAALALWDGRAGRREEFASACFFEGKATMSLGERTHWERHRAGLGEALELLPRELPLPPPGAAWIFPVLVAALVASPLLRPGLDAGDAPLTEELVEKAAREAERIVAGDDPFKKMDSLEDSERDDIERLRREINATAEGLRKSGEHSTREVLRNLEERAREAEKLAQRMGEGGDEWVSEGMLREMSQHADTADLATALKDRAAERSAQESEAISRTLKDAGLTRAVRERVETSLGRIMQKASAQDHKRPVGRNVGEAADAMAEDKPGVAGEDFAELARHFRRLAQRERAQEKLRKMAEALRRSGSSIAGKGASSMRKLAGASSTSPLSKKAMPASPLQLNPNLTPLSGANMPMPGQGKPMPMPGFKLGKGTGKAMMMAPVPGGGKGKPLALIPGQSAQPPSALVPIPGTSGGQSGAMAPGSGLPPGNGTAPLGGGADGRMEAARSGLVTAAPGADGESYVRAVEGGERSEEVARERREQAVDFIKVEEEALDEETLPLSRREHVLRYFSALRERFEES
ncbi:MAG: hypothetical protein ACC661_00985 [Verrucomicrobiales bacterium]